jgi:general secretion pathway protein A
MDYFRIRNLKQEPFSSSPDPDFFFESTVHLACLQQLEIAIRLRRGLNVVLGDVGTGKTTLCRELIRRLLETPEDRNEIETHLLLDPSFSTPGEFLGALASIFGIASTPGQQTEWQLKEEIKNFLFQKGVDENKTVVLIIDEGQKLSEFCREILRELLNYDTNEKKLLQIVIFAQNEFRQILAEHQNFADRVNQCYLLGPLNFRETREMIRFRLARAGQEGQSLFTLPALWAVYRLTGGYPRRIITLCHHVLLAAIIGDRRRAGWFLVRSTTEKLVPPQAGRRRVTATTAALTVTLAAALAVLLYLPAPQTVDRHPAPPVQTRVETVKTALPAAAQPAAKADAAKPEAARPAATPVPPPEPQKAASGQPPAMPAPTEATKKGPATPEAAPAAKPDAGASPAAPRTEPKRNVPSELGKVKLAEGDSVPQLLAEIYGSRGPDSRQALARANPQIPDIDQAGAGQTLVLPAVPASAPPLAPDKVWVQLAKKGSLNEALGLLRIYPSDMPPIRLVPSWNPREGLTFILVLKTGFPGPEGARAAMEHLPTGAKILEKAEPGTAYFAH